MDAATFRRDFPEFADVTVYPDSMVNFHLSIAASMLPVARWGETLDYGVELFTAHHLAIAVKNVQAADNFGAPGAVSGPQSSKSVDKVSASYDTGAVTLTDGGFWNMTSYGVRFLQLARMIGAGGYQL